MLSQHTLQVVSQHALQQVSGGVLSSMPYSRSPRGRYLVWGEGGVPGLGGSCSVGVWPSGVAFLLKVVFWFGGLLIEGSLLVESGLLFWPSGMAF